MFSYIGTEGSKLFGNGWFQCFFCLGTEGSNASLVRNEWFEWFSVQELNVPMVPYLEMDVPIVFCLGTQGSKVSYLEMGGSNYMYFLFKN